METNKITLKFKLVNTSHQELTLDCDKDELISQTKERLFNETDNSIWPTSFIKKEEVASFRFMYRGKELKDNQKLDECNFVTSYKDEEGIV